MNGHGCKPIVLAILDGWGLAPPGPGNAIEMARTPVFDHLMETYPFTTLKTSGRDVGLVDGQMGNSEVGHLNIGAGTIVNQMITKIDLAIEDRSFFKNQAFLAAIHHAQKTNRTLHLLGLVSDGGVHSHIQHLEALLELCKQEHMDSVVIHAILDGRDTTPTSGAEFLTQVERFCRQLDTGRLGTIVGRYYAMDRDHRWERTQIAYDLLVNGDGIQTENGIEEVANQYAKEITDEFMPAIRIRSNTSDSGLFESDDSIIFFNFRTDRPRQLTQALIGPDPENYVFTNRPAGLVVTGMTKYSSHLKMKAAFEPTSVENPLARIISDAGLHQFHVAETEKYAHVTYFLNGGREEPFSGEQREMVASPPVATYDLQPEMSAHKVATVTADDIESNQHDLIVINFANCDMVGHTGNIKATVSATETVDSGLGLIVEATLQAGGCLLVIADHGNAEQMLVPDTDLPMTAHTTNPVPCILIAPGVNSPGDLSLRPDGRLADIAPTILDLLNIEKPKTMTGTSLLLQYND